jgi:ABC-type ATPase with predicted acetyltransferase domain
MIFADEFCSNLDRITAAVISCNLRTVAAHSDKIFVLAGAHDDMLCDLQPDVIIVNRLGGPAEVIYKNHR